MFHTTLENGLRVLVDENHASRVAAIQVWVRVGSADELPEEAGLAHVHEHMLFKGTERRAVGEIATDIEAAGGDINAWTSFDETVYHVTIASREVDTALDILADAVQHSAFDAAELARELEVVIEEIRRGNDNPARVASEMLFDTAYQTHPYRRPVIGYFDTVRSFTRSGILAFYRKWYRPRNMCLIVVGDVDTPHIVERAKALFDGEAGQATDAARTRPREVSPLAIRTAKASRDIEETHLGLAWPGTSLAHEDTPALDLLSILLGMGDSSRLFQRVKREAELVNDCYATSYTPRDPGLIVAGAQIHGAGIEPAFRALLTETLRLRHEAPEESEIEKARTIILADAIYQKETVQGMARKLGYFELVAGNADFEETYMRKVKEVTSDDVLRVAKHYLRPEALSVATLMPTEFAHAMEPATVDSITREVVADLEKEHSPKRIQTGALGVAKVKLGNGATLLVSRDASVPLVSIRAAAVGGLVAELPENNGVSHLLAELLTRGTSTMSAEQVAEAVDAMGAGISGQAGRNSLGLRGDFLATTWERGLELFSMCLFDPAFEEEEIEKERKTQLEDIAARRDNLAATTFDLFASALFSEHPYRLPTMGSLESVARLDRAAIERAYRTQLRPDRLTIAVVGDVDVARTVDLVEAHLGRHTTPADAGVVARPRREAPLARSIAVFERREKEQAHMVLGFRGIAIDDPRRFPMDVLCAILGGQSGRLFLELRDKQSLAYTVSAQSVEGIDPGYFGVYIASAPEKLDVAEAGIRLELGKIVEHFASDAEISKAKRYLIGSHEIGLQRASARGATMALNEAYGIGYDDHAKYATRIDAVDAHAIREVAREIIRFDAVVRAVVASVEPRAL